MSNEELKQSANFLSNKINEIDTEYYLQLDEIDDKAYNKIESALDLLRDAYNIINEQIKNNV